MNALASPTAATLGLVGTGRQAWTQLWAISTVRQLRSVVVYRRDPVRRNAFAARVSAELGLVVTDSLAQTSAYDPPFVLTGTVQHDRLRSLGAVLAGGCGRADSG